MDSIINSIISGGFAVLGSVGTLLVSKIYDTIRDKRATQERLFNNLFPERIKAHQDIIREIIKIDLNKFVLFESIPDDMGERLTNAVKTVDELFKRHQIFASQNVLNILRDLGVLLRTTQQILSRESDDKSIDKFKEFAVSCNKLYFELLETARKESGAHFVDKGLELVDKGLELTSEIYSKQRVKQPKHE